MIDNDNDNAVIELLLCLVFFLLFLPH